MPTAEPLYRSPAEVADAADALVAEVLAGIPVEVSGVRVEVLGALPAAIERAGALLLFVVAE